MFSSLFKLRGKLENRQKLILSILGILLLLAIWTFIAYAKSDLVPITNIEKDISAFNDPDLPQSVKDSLIQDYKRREAEAEANATEYRRVFPVLPPPLKVFQAFGPLTKYDKVLENGSIERNDELIKETFKSIWLNLRGYFYAILISIPIGFLIGLLPIFRGLFNRPVDALRYLPLTAVTGLFMSWFGIEDGMKIAFLAFGIMVYLLPVIVQRIDEVKDVYLKTVFTLGANTWQTIRSVYLPSVLSRVSDDIRVLTAISWTYIIVAELVNASAGGVGALIFKKARLGRMTDVFAILLVIIIVGFFQDKYFSRIDRKLFPFKYLKDAKEKALGLGASTLNFLLLVIGVLYIVVAILPEGRDFLFRFLGDGFYVFLLIVIIELLLAGQAYLNRPSKVKIAQTDG